MGGRWIGEPGMSRLGMTVLMTAWGSDFLISAWNLRRSIILGIHFPDLKERCDSYRNGGMYQLGSYSEPRCDGKFRV